MTTLNLRNKFSRPSRSTDHFAIRRSRRATTLLLGATALLLSASVSATTFAQDIRPTRWIGYTESRNDLPGGQYENWVTSRACLVRADGTERRLIGDSLLKDKNSWTQFAGWSPEGGRAIVLSLWESPENAAWERAHKTFRMTEGWLVDSCLIDLASGSITNLTEIDRVSIYNTGLFFLPDGKGFGFTPLIQGVSKPFAMESDGKRKRDVSGEGGGFAYGYSASPDGKSLSYHENYQVYVSQSDGKEKRHIATGNPFNFAPQWSPDGEWLLFVSGEHYNCHPHVVRKDGTGLKKLADRGGYRGVVERLKFPDFHSESSDVPVWAKDGQSVYYTARVGESVELMRVSLEGVVTQLTHSAPGVRHYHPQPSPDGRWILFGSDRSGTMQLYVARADGADAHAVTNVPAGHCAMHGHWQAGAVDYEKDVKPILKQRCGSCHGAVKQEADLRLDAASLLPKDKHLDLLRRIASTEDGERMPPEGARLTADQIAVIREWIASGAPYPRDEVIPKKPADHWAFQPIQRPTLPPSSHANPIDALLFGQQAAAKQASRETLVRRVFLDLLGVPPNLAEQNRFTANADWAATVDELLARPEYGERWARHWLDVVRYADSNGYERDAEKPFVWRYRDYVIESLNKDKPFDRFILEQIAGDELDDASIESNIATGFLRLGHWDDEPADPATDRYDQLDDIVSTTSQTFLGLTIGCARCHDHKFEPLRTQDYYSFVAVFQPLERPRNGRTEQTVKIGETDVYAWREPAAKAPDTHILLRGSPTRRGELVGPAVPVILAKEQPAFPPASEKTTRRRLGLARWIASTQNPLTARVIVNRVWQQHFGVGLVSTANDFGLMGAAPTHPELLDWLAHWFMHDAQWSLKKLHRLILTSAAWQSQKAKDSPIRYRRLEVEAIRDSMLAVSGTLNSKRFGPAFRPAIPLAAIEANTDKGNVWKPSSDTESNRRSIYVYVKRGLIVPMFETLDLADTVSSCPQRQVTTVAPQALTLFNSEFTRQQTKAFAERLRREAPDGEDQQIELAWRLALCRAPSSTELQAMREFLKEESLEQLCRVVLNLNEFVYPE
jgi:Tol biopolymer transport system component